MRLLFLLACLPLLGLQTLKNDLPARIEWKHNHGYCGETSLIIAGLYYGQYLSQYDVRALASDEHSQQKQLLLGRNDKRVAEQLHLSHEVWDFRQQKETKAFLQWLKKGVAAGYPVVIGVYMNQYLFYGDSDPDAGDDDYDHIVPVIGMASEQEWDYADYLGGDILYYTDNGLWSDAAGHEFQTPMDAFLATRADANTPCAPIYTLPICDPSQEIYNYGIKITGVKDEKNETLPVRITTDLNGEKPQIENHSEERPPAEMLILTVTVSNIEPHQKCTLYKYKRLEDVPDSDFHTHADKACGKWDFENSTESKTSFVLTDMIRSNEMAIYRAVKG